MDDRITRFAGKVVVMTLAVCFVAIMLAVTWKLIQWMM